jgi:hypothetical protein
MAFLPILGAIGGYAAAGTATGAMLGYVGGSLLSSMMADDGGGGGSSAPAPAAMPSAPAPTPMPAVIPPSPSAAPGGTQAGAGVEEPNPVKAKEVSLASQQRRRGRRSTILTGSTPEEGTEYLGGV